MSYYGLYCFDVMGSVVFRDNYEAETSAEEGDCGCDLQCLRRRALQP